MLADINDIEKFLCLIGTSPAAPKVFRVIYVLRESDENISM